MNWCFIILIFWPEILRRTCLSLLVMAISRVLLLGTYCRGSGDMDIYGPLQGDFYMVSLIRDGHASMAEVVKGGGGC